MKLELTRIGNSRGIRIPKPIIAQCGLGDVVDLRITPEGLIIAPHRAAREGWKQAFAESNCEAEMLLDGMSPNRFDREDWKW
jgi:antitoxin MazE